MSSELKILGCVLAGGESTRMGRDKANLELDGTSLIERVVGSLRLCAEVVVVAKDLRSVAGARPIRDCADFQGPLAGLAAGLSEGRRKGFTHVFLTSCDLVGLRAEWVRLLAGESVRAVHDGVWQPMCSCWPTSVLIPSTMRSLRELLDDQDAEKVEPFEGWFDVVDVNTPELYNLVRGRDL